MIAGSTANGTVDLEYTPPTKVAPPLGDVVHQLEATIRRLQNTVAVQSEQMDQLHVHQSALTARIYALEMSVRELEARKK